MQENIDLVALVGGKLLTKPVVEQEGEEAQQAEQDEQKSTEDLVKDKIVGLYFSAHWCPPCRGFTPVLADFYTKMKEKGKNFEIIFITSDRDNSSFNEYYKTMPWLAVPFGSEKIAKAKEKFGITGIPTLIILNKDGGVITRDGRADVTKANTGDPPVFPWGEATK